MSNLRMAFRQTPRQAGGQVHNPNAIRGHLQHGCSLAGILFVAMAMTLRMFAGQSQSVELSWDPSASQDVVGYEIYYGSASGEYTNMISVGNTTNVTVAGLSYGTTYYFALTSINSDGFQSDYSVQASYTVPTQNTAKLGRPVFSSKGMSVPVTGVPGYLYVIQASTNLVVWISIQTNLPPLMITDTNSGRYKQRFFRAVPLY